MNSRPAISAVEELGEADAKITSDGTTVASMATPRSSAASERVWSQLPEGCRQVLEDELPPTDLQSLLLSLAQTRARRIRPAEVLRRWKSDRFVRPATIDPGRLSEVENRLWRRLRDTPFEGLALSPVTSLGTCTSVGAVDQNRIVSTVRSSEVVSDPCNVLALEAALRRRSSDDQVHLASCHRVLRAQRFIESDAFAHFVIFALVSSARDSGSTRTVAQLLIMHLGFWQQVLDELLGPTWGRFAYTLIGDQSIGRPLVDMVQSELPDAPLTGYPERTDSGRKRALSGLLRGSRTAGRFDAAGLGRHSRGPGLVASGLELVSSLPRDIPRILGSTRSRWLT
jgi:hypothetical protein